MVLHIVAGSLSLLAGFAALYASKGAPLHRRAGRVFVVVMLTMTLSGILMAAVRGAAPELNIPAGLLTAYLVVTGFTTLRPPARGARPLAIGGMLLALGVGLLCLVYGGEAIANGGTRKGMPAFPFYLFGLIGVLGSIGDFRLLHAGALSGAPRLSRHLWRMTMALWIATMSFFIGQADVIPQPLRIRPLLALPVLAVLVTLLYWVWRVRVRRSLRGVAIRSASPARGGVSRDQRAHLGVRGVSIPRDANPTRSPHTHDPAGHARGVRRDAGRFGAGLGATRGPRTTATPDRPAP
jgi:hypothetical protein